MAIRYAVANGNFSNAATWDGGASIPASGDYVYANGHDVALDTDVALGVGTLSTEICPTTSVGGGRFTYNTDRNVTANIKAGSSHCLHSTAAANVQSLITVVGNVDGTSSTACGIAQTISSVKNNSVTIIGNITKNAVLFNKQSNNSRVYFNLTGNADSTGGYCLAVSYSNATIALVNVVINGLITGNGYEFADPASVNSTGFAQLGTYVINGGVVAETALKVIYCATAIVTGYIENFGGKNAVDVSTSFQFTPTYYKIQNADGDDIVLMPSTTLENPPAESDVRVGVVYGIDDAYTGTLEVGGATPAEFVAALEASDLGQRMAKCAITEEVLTMLGNLE